MKRAFSLITFALVIALVFVSIVPADAVGAASKTSTIKVGSLTAQKGGITGAPSLMRKKDQTGTADNSSKYVLFTTPGVAHRSVHTFNLPSHINNNTIQNLRLRVNIKAPAPGSQKWIWSAYNWNTKKWVRIGDTASVTANTWSQITLQFPSPMPRFINNSGQVRIRFHSSNASGDAKIDSEFVLATYEVTSLCGETTNSTFENQVLTLINQHRSNNGRTALTRNSNLDRASRLHSADMGCNNFFDHTGSNGSYFGTRITNQGYSYSYAGENIAAGYNSPESVVTAWMNSSGHRANILSNNYKHIGIGHIYKSGSTYGHYWTTDFASP